MYNISTQILNFTCLPRFCAKIQFNSYHQPKKDCEILPRLLLKSDQHVSKRCGFLLQLNILFLMPCADKSF